jgi:polar amino acid transport system substrate-binding protein
MPNRLKQVVAGLVMGLCAILPAAASAQTVDESNSRGKLIIAVDTTTPPYGYLDSEL